MSAVLAMTDKRSILFQILFAVFDSLQGFVIVMVHCVLRREVEDDLKFALHTGIHKLFVSGGFFCGESACSVSLIMKVLTYTHNLTAGNTQ